MEYNLERDNRIDRNAEREGSIPQRARDMEAHQGVESFATWVQGEPKAALKAVLANEAATWDDVHRALAQYDLEIRPRGAGFIISDREGRTRIRASDVLREASKAKLEARFGPLEATPGKEQTSETRYTRAPRHGDSRALWQTYQQERDAHAAKRREAYAGIREAADAERATLRDREAAQRAKIWHDPLLSKAAKVRLTQGLTRQRAVTKGAVARRAQTQRASIRHLHPAPGWTDWLRKRAERGDTAALLVLRRTKGRALQAGSGEITLTIDHSAAEGMGTAPTQNTDLSRHFPPRPVPRPDHVDRRGVATHRVWGGDELRDDGRIIVLNPDPGNGALRLAFDLIAARGSGNIKIDGPDAERLAIAQFAGEDRRTIRFADPALEDARSQAAEDDERGAAPRLGGNASGAGGASGSGRDHDEDRGHDHKRPSWMPRPLSRGRGPHGRGLQSRDDGMDR